MTKAYHLARPTASNRIGPANAHLVDQDHAGGAAALAHAHGLPWRPIKLADAAVTGQLIRDPARRQTWLELVRALQEASEQPGGPLTGWVFHGTAAAAADSIALEGMDTTDAIASTRPGVWSNTEGCHFGSANVAAFFAEDLIESTENPDLELAILGVPLERLKACGEFAADGQMIDCPLYSRLRTSESEVYAALEGPHLSWDACWDLLETVLVLGPVPADLFVHFRSTEDLQRHLQSDGQRQKDLAPEKTTICVWPNGTWCYHDELEEMTHMSDDFERIAMPADASFEDCDERAAASCGQTACPAP